MLCSIDSSSSSELLRACQAALSFVFAGAPTSSFPILGSVAPTFVAYEFTATLLSS